MEAAELSRILARGEDSRHQFKRNVTNSDSLAEELVAFSNSGGGLLVIGVDDKGVVVGLDSDDIARLNQLLSNTASQNVNPAINPSSQNLEIDGNLVMLVTVGAGIRKPYMTKGAIVVKNGADKRKVTAVEEMQRMFQEARLIHGDEVPVARSSVSNIDRPYFADFLSREFGETLEDDSLGQTLQNMNLMHDGRLNTAAVLLFAQTPAFLLPVFIVKAVAFPGNDLHTESYVDSREITGRMGDVFAQAVSFVLSNIRHAQGDKSVNSIGDPVIPRIALEELVVNALIHRDYFISAPIRLLVFRDRIELISPGHLPNNLTVENIKNGNSNMRNPVLASFATRVLPYRGIGSGIRRALAAHEEIDLQDDPDGNQFKVIIRIPTNN